MSYGIDNLAISFITVSELYYGAYKSQRVDKNIAMVRKLTDQINVVESDDAISETFGSLKASLENVGLVIDDARALNFPRNVVNCHSRENGNLVFSGTYRL